MPETPNYGITYPSPAESANGPYAMQQLAESVEEALGDTFIQAGSASLDTPTASNQEKSFTFPTAFASAPIILVTPDITVGGVITHGTAVGITTTGFTIRYRASGTAGENRSVKWLAIGVRP